VETTENGRNQPERGDEFAEPLAEAVAWGVRNLEWREPEHQMRGNGPEAPGRDLRHDIEERRAAVDLAAKPHDERHGRIELRTETETKMVMRTTRIAAVASVLQRSASASSPASLSAMMPEPITAMTRKNVPSASAVKPCKIVQ
jgi:hypothetical protein